MYQQTFNTISTKLGGGCNTKLQVFCAQTDTWPVRQADSRLALKTFALLGYDKKKCWLLIPYSIYNHFDTSTTDSFENIVGRGEIARNEQFLLFPQCFLLNRKMYPHWSIFLTFYLFFSA